uniref:Uncharacterized protein n=1 Tax=Oryza barthii TaxID=65489 RepID=A0A0D3FXM0_9ORYZ
MGQNPSRHRRPSSSLLRASPPPELVAGKAGRRVGMAAAGPSSLAPPRFGAGVVTMAAGRRGRGDGDGAELGTVVGRYGVGSPDGQRRRQIWSPRLAGVIGDGLGRRRRRSADLAGRWLAAAMVADVAAMKLATTTPALVKNLATMREARRPRQCSGCERRARDAFLHDAGDPRFALHLRSAPPRPDLDGWRLAALASDGGG